MIPGSASPLLLASAAEEAAYTISRSLRFNSADSAYLSRTPSSAGNRKTWTWSGWVKRSGTGNGTLFSTYGSGDSGLFSFEIDSNNLRLAGQITQWLRTSAVFRDFSAWYHIVLATDTTQATAADRFKLYVNGVQITAFAATSYPSQNADLGVNSTVLHHIGSYWNTTPDFNGYLADVHFIDGQALDPTSFGEFDEYNNWQPKAASISSPNDGTTWSDYLTSSTNNFYTGAQGVEKGFDNDTSTYVQQAGGVNPNSITFTPPSGIAHTSSVEVWLVNAANQVSYNNGSLQTLSSGSWQTVATGSGTLTSLKFERASTSGASFAAIRVDGVILVDGATAFGTNGFKLDFSDATSTTTIAEDSSGNNNDWTANNISVLSTIWSTQTSTSGNYSQYLTNGPANAFDGSTSTTWQFSGTTAVAKFTPTNPIAYSSQVRVYVNPTGNIANTRWSVNGGSLQTFSTSGAQWLTVLSGSGSFTEFALHQNGDIYTMGFAAVEIDGTILVDGGPGCDSLFDSPTNSGTDTGSGGEVSGNYATLNPLKYGGDIQAPTNGNLEFTASGSSYGKILGTIGVSSGKWYWECVPSSSQNIAFGITKDNTVLSNWPGQDAVDYTYHNSGSKYNNSSSSAYGASFTTGDVIGVALDADNGTLTFYKNNSNQGQAYSGLTSGPYFPLLGDPSSTPDASGTVNFGQRPFAYTAPSGFKALCTANLDEPTVPDGSTAMDAVLWTGNGSTQSITGLGFSPDLVWGKKRNGTTYHNLVDIVRGANKELYSNDTSAETTPVTAGLTAFNSDGFTLGANSGWNANSDTYVGWTWDAGSSTVSNTDGSITSSVRANPTAGFSVVTWTGQTAAGSIGHGLNAAPSLIICKARSNAQSWGVYHEDVGINSYLLLDSTGASTAYSGIWGSSAPTSSVFSVPGNVGLNNNNGWTYVGYCFAPVEGYSAFGSYEGNSNADGPFVYTGFRPSWILIKNIDDGIRNWDLYDTARGVYNPVGPYLFPNGSTAESNSVRIDILSNGFKLRTTSNGINNQTMIYAAFAEHPFRTSRAR